MNHYQKMIIEITDCKPEDSKEVEDYMRDIIFHSTLDWQSKAQFAKGAREAWGDIQFMRSPEGQKYLAEQGLSA